MHSRDDGCGQLFFLNPIICFVLWVSLSSLSFRVCASICFLSPFFPLFFFILIFYFFSSSFFTDGTTNNKCPAIMFAVRRTGSVPGRIRFLIVSIITINGISMVGVPWGTRCSNMWLMFLIHPNSINLTHKGKASVSVRIRYLVLVKMYGNSPKRLFIRIIRNRDVRMNEFPLFSFPFLKIVIIYHRNCAADPQLDIVKKNDSPPNHSILN